MDRYPFDAEYLRRLREGDQVTVDHFVRYFTEKLTIKLWKRGLSKSAIDDCIQETFTRVLSKLDSPDGIVSPESFGAFVFGVANNYLYEQYRETMRQDQLDDSCFELPSPDPDVEQRLLSGERGKKARQTLEQMKPKESEILIALFMEEQSKDDICTRFHIDRSYLRVVLHRAIARFRFLFPQG